MDLALYPSHPHGTLGLGGCGLAGAARAEARDEPHLDPGLLWDGDKFGHGVIMGN